MKLEQSFCVIRLGSFCSVNRLFALGQIIPALMHSAMLFLYRVIRVICDSLFITIANPDRSVPAGNYRLQRGSIPIRFNCGGKILPVSGGCRKQVHRR